MLWSILFVWIKGTILFKCHVLLLFIIVLIFVDFHFHKRFISSALCRSCFLSTILEESQNFWIYNQKRNSKTTLYGRGSLQNKSFAFVLNFTIFFAESFFYLCHFHNVDSRNDVKNKHHNISILLASSQQLKVALSSTGKPSPLKLCPGGQ